MRSDEHDATQPLREGWHHLTEAEHLTPGERVADGVARQMGSWRPTRRR